MDWSLHPAHIRALLTSDTRDMDAPTEEWIDTLTEMLDEHGPEPLIAWTHAEGGHDSTATFEPDAVAERFRETYRGYHDSAWEFARDSWVVDLQEYGDEGEQKGRESFMNDFSSYIDWRAVADSPLLSDYTMIRLGGEDDARVHVFELEV